MLVKLLQFEWRFHSRQTSFFVFSILFLMYGILAITTEFQYLEISSMYNDAFNLHFLSGIISLAAIFPTMFFCINGVLRDADSHSEELIFSTGIQKTHYVLSRFLGVFSMTLFMATISFFGIYFGTLLNSGNPETIHVFNISHYVWPWLTIILPNVFICSALLFSMSLWSGKAISTYVTGILILAISWMSQFYINSPLTGGLVLSNPEVLKTASIIDLLGLSAFFEQTQFLTSIEKNDFLVMVSGHFLWNRLLWILIGSALLFGTYSLFSFRKVNQIIKKEKKIIEPAQQILPYTPVVTAPTTIAVKFNSFKALVLLDIKSTLKSIPFVAILVIWAAMLGFSIKYSTGSMETFGARYATTDLLLGIILEVLPFIGLLLVVFYSGELVWKTRNHKFNEIIDTTPVSNGTFFCSKLIVLVMIPMLLILASIFVALCFQIVNGYYHFEGGLYASVFYYGGVQLVLYAIFALFIQSLVPNKYLGMIISGFIMILFGPLSETIGLEHPLALFNNIPNMSRAYSSFMGYGQYAHKFNWMTMYWSALAGILVLLSYKFWKRGEHTSYRSIFKLRWTPKEKRTLLGLLVLFLSLGGYIFYSINIVNTYTVEAQQYDFNENYERAYKKYDALAVPQVISVATTMDIYPEEQRYHLFSKNKIKNSSGKVMHEIFVTTRGSLNHLTIENTTQIFHDSILHTYLFKLNTPLLPNEVLDMEYESTKEVTGFQVDNSLSTNGTYIKARRIGPLLGYVNQFEIQSAYEREQRGLTALTTPVLNDAHLQTSGKFNFEKASFETVISSSNNQIALSSGTLVKQWREGDRKYFQYTSEEQIDPMTAYFSADYKIEKVTHKGVSIEVYYLAEHYKNVPEMIKVTKATIDYCTENFGLYPRKYIRIAEMSRYGGSYGIAFPGIIGINEMVFKKNIEDPKYFNVIARLIVHEISHQWWGHLLNAKQIKGSKVFSESLAKYSETVILEKLYGESMVKRLSETTQRRYFGGRSRENRIEPALYLSENQAYVIYSKGAVVFNAIRELIGEEKLNTALKSIVSKYHQGSIVTTLHLLDELYLVTPTAQHVLLDDWLKRVITYDLGIETARYKKLDDGNFELTVAINATRFEVTDKGREIEIEINEPIKIGVFAKHPSQSYNEDVLYLQSHHIDKKSNTIKITVAKLPRYISVDPYLTRLDRNKVDNVKLISE